MEQTQIIADNEREFPRSHQIQLSCFLIFFLIWFLDSFFVKFLVNISELVPLVIRAVVAVMVLGISFFLMKKSHDSLFEERNTSKQENQGHQHPSRVITTGIMSHVRHPLYLGTVLFYLSFALVTLSIISIITCIIIFVIYDRMASFEEKQMEKMFGKEYSNYKQQVSKWLPI
ncbi:MAG: methyltransferase family protein [Candidatus Hodarchaeales archaeon]